MIAIDFSPSLHGHFLEYIINRYIYNCDEITSIFEDSGASDVIENDERYQRNLIVKCDHYSEFNKPYPQNTTSVIYIKHNTRYDFVSMVNSFYRVFDRTQDTNHSSADILKFHMNNLDASSVSDVRNRLYTKLFKRHFDELHIKKETNIPVIDFDFGSFFTLHQFIASLRRVADSLNTHMTFNKALVNDWSNFIKVNQGYQFMNIAEDVIDSIIKGKSKEIEDNVFVHAYINCHLSHAFPIYTGSIFDDEKYPTNTYEIYNLINEITT